MTQRRRCPRCKAHMKYINSRVGHRCPDCLLFIRPDGTVHVNGRTPSK